MGTYESVEISSDLKITLSGKELQLFCNSAKGYNPELEMLVLCNYFTFLPHLKFPTQNSKVHIRSCLFSA